MGSVTWEGPSPIQCSTSVTKRITLHLNAFRGEPAISAFDWHFTRLPTAHPSLLQQTPVRASTGFHTRFPLAMGRSRSFGSVDGNSCALFGLAFARPACRKHLSGRRQQLAGSLCKRHAVTPLRRGRLRLFAGNLVSGSVSLPSRGAFHLSLTVLVRYRWPGVFSLGGWSPRIPPGFLVSRGTWVPWPSVSTVAYRTVTVSGGAFQRASAGKDISDSVPGLPSRPHGPTTLMQQRRQAWHCLSLGCSAFARRY